MNPKVLAWAGGDVEKTNIHAGARDRIEKSLAYA